jgi:hypothetical protein
MLSIRPVVDGGTLRVEVHSEGIPGLHGYQFTPSLDPTQLQLEDAREADLLGRGSRAFWRQVADPHSAGATTIVATRLGAGAGVTGPGGLTMVTFRALHPTRMRQMAFGLRDIGLVDSDGAVIASSRGITFPLAQLVPTASALLPNYPTPFNPATWMPFDLSDAADAAITVYDATGSQVRRIELGRRGAGMHRTRQDAAYWDGRSELGEQVASGVYVYELQAGAFRETRRMLVRK